MDGKGPAEEGLAQGQSRSYRPTWMSLSEDCRVNGTSGLGPTSEVADAAGSTAMQTWRSRANPGCQS